MILKYVFYIIATIQSLSLVFNLIFKDWFNLTIFINFISKNVSLLILYFIIGIFCKKVF